jgi:predicted ArsR family transcriptional regulator
MSRALAAFHLDKLAAAGLLDVTYRRLSSRTGPGAGRPSKLYRKSSRQIDVTLPPRRYELAARLLAQAIQAAGPAATKALEERAKSWGHDMGSAAREQAGKRAGAERLERSAFDVLRSAGFEPRRESGAIVLGNCPFEALTSDSRALICSMNLALCRGLIAGLHDAEWRARLEPKPDRCCVVIAAQ